MTDDAATPALTLDLTDAPTTADIDAIRQGLIEYNSASATSAVPDHRALCIFVRDETGTIVGGLSGYTQWQWLYVDYLWLSDTARRSGLGGRVLAAAEDEARARGCTHSRLYTYDFQAPGFYARQGYEQWGVLENYPPGHRQIWFRKTL
jgi:GNAT superfamily N-acetyltransferase